ncbi:hypothetical protein PHMEG_00037308 [Phytophthora megakarya]|uniref:Uncharacterized protein n=1 Tax=Phytophthora megakarya TaxID=4795 RepID=A0A225UK35_9STRA|nr:hypothetical protein PHMEG_00037308 [Phytophthora megakarya]
MGKDAAYLAASKRLGETRDAAVAKKKALGKNKMTKTQEDALQKEEKKAQEAVAMVRAAAATAARAAEKEKERQRVAEEEQLRRDARQGALSQLDEEVDGSVVHTKKGKRAASHKTKSKPKKKQKTTTLQNSDPEDDGDADDASDSVASSPAIPTPRIALVIMFNVAYSALPRKRSVNKLRKSSRPGGPRRLEA